MLMKLGDEKALQILSDDGIEINEINSNTIEEVRNRILQEITRLEIQSISKKLEEETSEKFNYLKTLVQLSNLFHRNLDRNMSLTEWNVLIDEAKHYMKHGKVRESQQGG